MEKYLIFIIPFDKKNYCLKVRTTVVKYLKFADPLLRRPAKKKSKYPLNESKILYTLSLTQIVFSRSKHSRLKVFCYRDDHFVTLSCRSFDKASEVFDLAMCSNQRPKEINTNNIGGVSKNVIGEVS